MQPGRARELANAAEGEFLQALAACAGSRAGRALDVASRSVQPLALRVNRRSIGERAVYIGNAARTLHPVAGQGLNLGLRDAWDLAQIMRAASDPGDAGLLARFSTRRRADARGAIYVTDSEGGAVYRVGGPGARMQRVVADQADFNYPNGLATSSDGRWLFVAHVEGLSRISLDASGETVRVRVPPDGALSAIPRRPSSAACLAAATVPE